MKTFELFTEKGSVIIQADDINEALKVYQLRVEKETDKLEVISIVETKRGENFFANSVHLESDLFELLEFLVIDTGLEAKDVVSFLVETGICFLVGIKKDCLDEAKKDVLEAMETHDLERVAATLVEFHND